MEANRKRRVVVRRKPLSDITNTSLPVSPKPHRTNPSSSSSSSTTTSSSALDTRVTENTVAAATNLDNAPNPTHPSPSVPSTPTLKAPSLHAADSITPPSIQIVDAVDAEASDDVEAYDPVQPISVVYSLRRSSNKRKKDKGKAVAVPVSSTPNLKISDSLLKNYEFEGLNLSKAKTLTSPRAKNRRKAVKLPWILEYIAKQISDYEELCKFEMEVESSDELDHPPYFKKVDKVEVKVESSDDLDDLEMKVESSDDLDHPAYLKKVDKVEVKVESSDYLDDLEVKVESSDDLDHPAYFKKVVKVEVKVESSEELDKPAYFKKVDKIEVKGESGAEITSFKNM